MPKLLRVRSAKDADEEAGVHRLSRSRLAPGAWIQRAQMIVRSWKGLRVQAIAEGLRCYPQSDREHIIRFDQKGISGLETRPGSGRQPRLTEIVSLYTEPPLNGTVLCLDELGPLIPRPYPPIGGWSRDGHRIKVQLEYSRGPEQATTFSAPSMSPFRVLL